MARRSDPWYVHLGLYAVIVVLAAILVQVAILEPQEIVAREKYYQKEARLRMKNLKEAQILYKEAKGQHTDDLDSLIMFVEGLDFDSLNNTLDSLTKRPLNPFIPLSNGEFEPESLYTTPKLNQRFEVYTTYDIHYDTTEFRRGSQVRIEVDTNVVVGDKYLIIDPAGYGTVGDTVNEALRHSVSWE